MAPSQTPRPLLAALVGSVGVTTMLAFTASSGAPASNGCFALGSAVGATRVACPPVGTASRPSAPAAAGSMGSVAVAAAAMAVGAAAAVARRSRTACGAYQTHERKWWSIEETRDPTSLPLWQRDYRFAYQVLKRTMVDARKKGKKVFWDVRVLKSEDKGCKVEMLNSGLVGWCPKNQEGKERLQVGDVVKMECTKCPQKRVDDEPRHSPWPKWHGGGRRAAQPYFSHYLYQEQQNSIAAAQSLEAGTVVKGTVFKHIAKGLIIRLEGENEPKGMLDMTDISRKMTPHSYVDKMFPIGTEMKLYVVHADKENGRITLSTKEFEDDEHVGWMLSFPERCFKMADEAVAKYHQKREAYIAMLQQ